MVTRLEANQDGSTDVSKIIWKRVALAPPVIAIRSYVKCNNQQQSDDSADLTFKFVNT